MPKSLTKSKWESLRDSLLHVPVRDRNLAWKESMDFAVAVIAGKNNLTPEIDDQLSRFAVECNLCHRPIGVEEDFVRKGLTSVYVHYDCHHRSPGDRV